MFKFNFNRKKGKENSNQAEEDTSQMTIDIEEDNQEEESSDKFNINEERMKDSKKFSLSKKSIIIIISGLVALCLIGIVGIGGMFLLNMDSNNNTTAITEIVDNSIKLRDSISMQVKIGTSKEDILTKFNIPSDKVGKNHVTLESFNRILDCDFLTTFIFKDDVLVATVHERIMDGTQKQSLAVETQAFIANLAENYKLDDTSTLKNIEYKWLGLERKYDNSTWNSAIINNELEIFANIEYNNESIQIVSSGINYFNFLAKQRKSTAIGNMVIVYTDIQYKNDFAKFAALAI